jgi:hypothetical protein
MANTKRSIRIFPANTDMLDNCVNIANEANPITLAEMGTTAVVNAPPTGATYIEYAGATAQQHTVTLTSLQGTAVDTHVDNIDFEITLIDVTDGREKFPRRTYTAATPAALKDAITTSTILAGDGFAFTATETGGVITIVSPADRAIRVAASDGAVIAETVAPVFHKAYTREEAIEFCKQAAADQYGRTNRVKFPVVEPNVETALGTATSFDYMIITKVSETKFDKNFGAGYQDVETFEFLSPTGRTNNSVQDVT